LMLLNGGRWVVLLCQRKSLREILFDVVELGAALLGEEKSLNQREKNKVARRKCWIKPFFLRIIFARHSKRIKFVLSLSLSKKWVSRLVVPPMRKNCNGAESTE